MGFFKNIGKTIKKASKQISLKNVVKIASSFDPTGIAGGVIGSIQAKKDEKKALLEQQKAQAEYDKQILLQNEAEAKKQMEIVEQAKAQAEYQRQLMASNTQAVGGKIGVVVGSIGGSIGKEVLRTASENIDKDLQTGIAKAGANLANLTLNEWLKLQWWKVLLGIVAVGTLVKIFMGGQQRR
jgi:hypothetical protein